MKLFIELVPSTSWYNNLRKALPKEEWDRIRKKCYANAGFKCEICGAKGMLNCHEIWKYDDAKHIQKLEGFVALCELCHHIKHIGLSNILASEGKLDMDRVIEHFMKVNGCDRKTFEQHEKEAFSEWKRRSSRDWKVVLGMCKKIINGKQNGKENENSLKRFLKIF